MNVVRLLLVLAIPVFLLTAIVASVTLNLIDLGHGAGGWAILAVLAWPVVLWLPTFGRWIWREYL